MPQVRSVAVFCGSSHGHAPVFAAAAAELGQALAERGLRLIYGGGRIGLMGVVADAALAAGGAVTGVIPDFLSRREIAHTGVHDLEVTDSMHSRKLRMFELADAFVSFPGGLGTLDETFEILTWRQLRLHDKPILICDIAGSATPLIAAVNAAIAAGFAKPDASSLYELTHGVPATVQRLTELTIADGGVTALL